MPRSYEEKERWKRRSKNKHWQVETEQKPKRRGATSKRRIMDNDGNDEDEGPRFYVRD